MKTFSKLAGTLAALCLFSLAAFGQGVNVTATLTDGQGIPQKTSYLHWQLWNCGNNVPQVIGQPYAMVAQQFDMRANPSTGVISGAVYGNDQILCGNVLSTQWVVTEFKSSGQAGGQPQYYCLTNGETFNPATTQVCQIVPPPPGYILQFDNPIQSQTLIQPEGTQMNFQGVMNFCSATVLCGGGEGEIGSLEINGVPLTGGDTVNFNNSTPAAGSNGINVTFQTSKASTTDSVSAEIVGDGNSSHCLNGTGAWSACGGASGPTLQTNGTPNSSQSLLNILNGTGITASNPSGGGVQVSLNNQISAASCTLCDLTFNAQGQLTAAASGSNGLPSSPQIGDTIRYNVNGDSAWDAVNATAKFVFIAVQNGSGIFDGGFGNGGAVTGVAGSLSATAPTANDNSGFTYSATASASTNTVIGVVQGAAANNGSWGFQAFYRWTHRFAIGSTTGCRYWTGLVEFVNGTYNTPVGTAVVATNTPNSPIVGFRYSAGTDSHWQAVSGTSSSTITVVDTGVTPDTNPHTFEVAWTGSAYVYLIDHSVVATISTNIPSASAVGTVMFWTGDNENAANACAGTIYHMMETLK